MICGKSSTSQSLLWNPGHHTFSLSPQTLFIFCQWIHSVLVPSMSAQTHSLISFLYENQDLMIYGNFLRCHVVHSINYMLEGEKCRAEGKAAKTAGVTVTLSVLRGRAVPTCLRPCCCGEEPTQWKRPWCWGRLKARRAGGNRGGDS